MTEPNTHSPAAASTAPRPVRTCLGLLLPLLCIVALLLLLLGGLFGGARWLLASEDGTRWLLARLPMVQVQGFQGALLGGQWRAEKLRVEWGPKDARQWLLIEGLAADQLEWAWRPSPQAWVGLRAQRLVARKLTLHSGPPSGQPLVLPQNLQPPVQLALGEVQLDELQIDELQPLRQLHVQTLVIDPRPGQRHSLQRFSGEGFGVLLEGSLSLGNAAPLPLQAQASVRPLLDGDNPRWAAVLKAEGSAADLQLSGTLRGRPAPGHAAPSVDLRAGLRPLQAWPLAGLDLRTEALDLAALTPSAPATRLSGQARLQGGAKGSPLQATVQLDNKLPGRWNEGRLPLRQLLLEAHGSLDRPDRLELNRFELSLADALRGAGRWSGSAVWAGHELTLDTRLQDVTPQRLDSRAAAMTLTGPVAVTLVGLPTPDYNAPAAPLPPPRLSWRLDLQGQLDNAPQPVRLRMQGSADDEQLDVSEMRAEAGKASAELKARLARNGPARGADWQLVTTGQVQDFDPLPWWPGDPAAAWRKGPHRLSGQWQFDIRLPSDTERLKPLEVAQRVAGNGKLSVHNSQIAGVPLTAEIELGYTQAAAPTPASLRAELTLGGNQLRLEGRGDPAGKGDADRWRAELQAGSLATLAPLVRLQAAAAEWAPRQGALQATLSADGRWPQVRTEGNAKLTQLLAGKLSVARGSALWRLDLGGEQQPLSLQAELAGLVYGDKGAEQRADHLRADLRGTLAEHRIDISGALPLVPPPMAEQMLAIQAQSGTRAQLQAQGQWLADPAGGGRWKAQVSKLLVGSWDGSADSTPPASGWAEARELRAELQFDGDGQLLALQADAGRLRLADVVALRWDAINIDLRPAQPLIQLRADIEPFALAPLLARAQPGMGWAGDLKLSARVDIRAAERMDADIVFERAGGDLDMSTSEGTQLLGLTEVRVKVSAHDGVWNFSPSFKGRSLGEISGQVLVQTTPERRWPQPEAPIEGSVQARVNDIGIWGAWVPPGWRLAGELRTTAAVSGTFGAPRYVGEITGRKLGVRNLLQGVNVSDGQIAARLEGDTARIEAFTFKGGDGVLKVTGGATLGATPQARLQIEAERFRVLGRVDRQVIASGNAELTLSREAGRLEGKFSIDEGLFDASASDAPSLDDDVSVRRAGTPVESSGDANAPKPKRNFVMSVDLDLGSNLRVRGRGLDTGLRGQLRLASQGGPLSIIGSINTVAGTYKAYGQKLDIERGVIAFSGAPDNPRLDVLALRTNIDQRVGVAITGTVVTPRVRLYSEPEMSDTDKLSWLVLGRAPDGLGRSDTALLQRAAVALLSGEGEAPTDSLMTALGIDDISLGQREGTGDVRETVVSIGKQLSRRWYVGYERGVNATTGTWQLTYRIAQRFTLRAQSGLENALDVIWTWRFQETSPDAAMRKSTITPP
jgi:translocation and assembly module TamB